MLLTIPLLVNASPCSVHVHGRLDSGQSTTGLYQRWSAKHGRQTVGMGAIWNDLPGDVYAVRNHLRRHQGMFTRSSPRCQHGRPLYYSYSEPSPSAIDKIQTGNWPTNVRPILDKVSHAFVIFYLLYITVIVFAVIRVISAIFLKAGPQTERFV